MSSVEYIDKMSLFKCIEMYQILFKTSTSMSMLLVANCHVMFDFHCLLFQPAKLNQACTGYIKLVTLRTQCTEMVPFNLGLEFLGHRLNGAISSSMKINSQLQTIETTTIIVQYCSVYP